MGDLAKKYFSILLVFFCCQIFSQEKAFEELDNYLSDYRNFDFQKFCSFEFQNFDFEKGFNKEALVTRERDWKVTEKIYYFEISYWVEKKFQYRQLNLHTFSQNGDIFLIIYHNDIFGGDDLSPVYFGRMEKIQSILNAHNQFYNSNISVEEMINQLSDGEVYGYVCGYAPILEDIPTVNSYKFDDKSNLDIFRSWLQSFNLELQTYGVDAMESLKKNTGIKLTEEDKKLIQHIKGRNSLLNSCSGCLVGLYEKAF